MLSARYIKSGTRRVLSSHYIGAFDGYLTAETHVWIYDIPHVSISHWNVGKHLWYFKKIYQIYHWMTDIKRIGIID